MLRDVVGTECALTQVLLTQFGFFTACLLTIKKLLLHFEKTLFNLLYFLSLRLYFVTALALWRMLVCDRGREGQTLVGLRMFPW